MDIFTASARRGVLAAVAAGLACTALLVPAAPAAADTGVCVPATQICVDDGGASDAVVAEAQETADEAADQAAGIAFGVAGVVLGVPPAAVDAARGAPDVCVTTVCVRGTGATVAQYDDRLCSIRSIHPNVQGQPYDWVRRCP